MARFIELTERYSKEPLLVNVNDIQTFHSHHKLGADWQFSHIVMKSYSFDVLETQEEFKNLLILNSESLL